MGLFNFGGFKKQFVLNTAQFKDEITEMMNSGSRAFDVAKILNKALGELDRVKTLPRNAKDAEAEKIDERIFKLLQSMRKDLQAENNAAFREHAKLMFEAISQCRAFGEEKYSEKELQIREAMVECQAEIYNALDEKENLEKEKERLIEQATKASPNEQAKLALMFKKVNEKLAVLQKRVSQFTSRHQSLLNQLKVQEHMSDLDKLRVLHVSSLDEYETMVTAVEEGFAEELQYDDEIQDMTSTMESRMEEGINSSKMTDDSEFFASVEARKNENTHEAIENVQFGGASADPSMAEFFNAIGKK